MAAPLPPLDGSRLALLIALPLIPSSDERERFDHIREGVTLEINRPRSDGDC